MSLMIESATKLFRRHRHINWALADQAMISGTHFLRALLLVRFLGIEEFGRFSLAWMVVLFASSIHAALVLLPMMSIGPKQSDTEAPYYYGAVCIHQLLFIILTFVSVIVGGFIINHVAPTWHIEEFILVCAFATCAFLTQDFLRRYFFTLGHLRTAFVNDMISYGGQLGILLILFRVTTLGSVDALWVAGAASAFAAGVGGFTMARLAWRNSTLRKVTQQHWNFSKWLALSALCQWAAGNIFVLATGAILGAASVGILKAAQTIMGVLHIFFIGIGNAVLPRAAWHFQSGGLAALRGYLGQIALMAVISTIVVAGAAGAAPNFWLRLAYGEAFVGYGYILQWYAVIFFVACMDIVFRVALQTKEHTRPILAAEFAATLFSVTAAYPLIAWQGLTGVMIGIFVSRCIIQLILFRGNLAILNIK